MQKLARAIVAKKPKTIVIASPHNLRLLRKIAVVLAENSTGTLRTSPRREVTLSARCNVKLAREILDRAVASELPVIGANYGTFEGPTSDLQMDWGTLVPLWFVLRGRRLKAEIIIVTPSREIPLKQNVRFGSVIGKLLERKRDSYVFVASADQAHAHDKDGPYGFDPAAEMYDHLVTEAIERNRLESLLDLRPDFVESAKPDSLWPMAILAGLMREVRMIPRLISYEVPTYYGMICASFERIR